MKKILILGAVSIIAILGAFTISGNLLKAHYDDSLVSFDYPNNWNITQKNSSLSGKGVDNGEINRSEEESWGIGEAPVGSGKATLNKSTITELGFQGPGIKSARITVYKLNETLLSSFKEELKSGFSQKDLNGYTYYEEMLDTKSYSRYAGIFIKNDISCVIIISGEKDQAYDGFKMIVNSLRIK